MKSLRWGLIQYDLHIYLFIFSLKALESFVILEILKLFNDIPCTESFFTYSRLLVVLLLFGLFFNFDNFLISLKNFSHCDGKQTLICTYYLLDYKQNLVYCTLWASKVILIPNIHQAWFLTLLSLECKQLNREGGFLTELPIISALRFYCVSNALWTYSSNL